MKLFEQNEILGIKTLSDLPESVEKEMRESRLNLKNEWKRNDSYHVLLVNEDGTRYFFANRKNDFGGSSSTYSCWHISYGKVSWKFKKEPFNTYVPEWVMGKTFKQAQNGTNIPGCVSTKAEVMAIAKEIGIFEI